MSLRARLSLLRARCSKKSRSRSTSCRGPKTRATAPWPCSNPARAQRSPPLRSLSTNCVPCFLATRSRAQQPRAPSSSRLSAASSAGQVTRTRATSAPPSLRLGSFVTLAARAQPRPSLHAA
eukprot:Amastigsp_a2667_5.p7 type:complete len:122 gc:universal Amastigsp_a2667_5:1216-1581(+)